ncbi:MAG: hypothetical protein KBT02_00685 [Treponema sp.]|nr:hypothetical protein [Candidatus Treponema caballi]
MKTVSRKAICFLCLLLVFALCALPLAAQSEDDFFFDDDVFTSSDDVFGESSFSDISFGDDDVIFEAWGADGDDALFADEGIEVLDESASSASSSDGTIFEAGSVKIGGRLSSSVGADFLLYDEDDDTSFGDRLYDMTISPAISADISLDARPSDTLRMYTKFSLGYPFQTTGTSAGGSVTVSDFLNVKEMFTDFSLADRAFFRFGLHTVSWGTGYFFSPCSDMINSGKIDPENADEQVDGSLNLRTQIIFPGSQNCLWLYAIPETGSGAKARDTALAAKMEFVTGGFELGGGAFYQYEKAPKAMMTASGSIINGKVSVFGEGVFQYGADSEWAADTSFEDKTALFKATAGFSYMWKDPEIMLMGQYLYDGNNVDDMLNMSVQLSPTIPSINFVIPNQTYGHNIALMTSFSKLPLLKDCSFTLFGLVNIGKEDIPEETQNNFTVYKNFLKQFGYDPDGIKKNLTVARATATLNYAPSSSLSFSAGVSSKWVDFDSKPVLEATLGATLGGGKF